MVPNLKVIAKHSVISQRCPKCKSKRIRRGYKKLALIVRMFGLHELLCDDLTGHSRFLDSRSALPDSEKDKSYEEQSY